MLPEERRRFIVDLLGQAGYLSTQELADRLEVSIETVRRDLMRLERQGRLERVHGGASLLSRVRGEAPFGLRQQEAREAKSAIGRAAAALVQDGETVVLDTGTTVLEVARHLHARHLTVLTPSLPVAAMLSERADVTLYIIGGEVRSEEMTASGPLAEAFLAPFRVDRAVVCAGAISLEHGISDFHVQEATLRRRMIDGAGSTLVVADRSKIGRRGFIQVTPWREGFTWVTDGPPPDPWPGELERQGVRVVTP